MHLICVHKKTKTEPTFSNVYRLKKFYIDMKTGEINAIHKTCYIKVNPKTYYIKVKPK